MKIAIVYDWIDKWGGVERLLLTLHEQYPDADWYTSYYDQKSAVWAKNLRIKTSFIQKLPAFIRNSRLLSFILYPYAFESFNLNEYDLVVSVTSSFAKGVITKPQTKHICYLLTPTRYLWGMTDVYLSKWKQIIFAPLLKKLRKWDYIAAQRPDVILTLSKHVANRCLNYYKREAKVVYPPFDIQYWDEIKKSIPVIKERSDYYLVVSRLEYYKKVNLLIDLFNQRGDKLIIVGTGSQKLKLQQKANNNIFFKENLSDKELAQLYIRAKALIMPQEEDFGYVSLEAQFFGCPVIAYKESGVSETLDKTNDSRLVDTQSIASFQHELERFEAVAYNVDKRQRIHKEHFEQFSQSHFINTLLKLTNT